MKIIRTEMKNTGLVEFKQSISKVGKAFKKNLKRNLIITATLVLIVGAVFLNVILFNDNGKKNLVNDPSKQADAQNSGQDTDAYFASAQVERSKARDEALDVLSQITSSDVSTKEAVDAAYASIAQIAKDIEDEATIENLIKAKGFSDCVTIISDGKCSVIVSSAAAGLAANEIAQIQEIVLNTSGILPANTKIISRSEASC